MAQSLYGFTISWSGTTPQNLTGVAAGGTRSGTYVIRANNAGIFLGGSDLAGSSSGFELIGDKEYTLSVKAAVSPGSGADNAPYVMAPGGGANSLSYLFIPE